MMHSRCGRGASRQQWRLLLPVKEHCLTEDGQAVARGLAKHFAQAC